MRQRRPTSAQNTPTPTPNPEPTHNRERRRLRPSCSRQRRCDRRGGTRGAPHSRPAEAGEERPTLSAAWPPLTSAPRRRPRAQSWSRTTAPCPPRATPDRREPSALFGSGWRRGDTPAPCGVQGLARPKGAIRDSITPASGAPVRGRAAGPGRGRPRSTPPRSTPPRAAFPRSTSEAHPHENANAHAHDRPRAGRAVVLVRVRVSRENVRS